MKLTLLTESANTVTLYRTDPGRDDPKEVQLEINNGKYGGGYFTSKKRDALSYYPGNVLLTVKLPVDELTVDGHNSTIDFIFGHFDNPVFTLEELKKSLTNIPREFHDEFWSLIKSEGNWTKLKNEMGPQQKFWQRSKSRNQGPSVRTDDGYLSKAVYDFFLKVSKKVLFDHLESHGQVALLHRNIRPDEVVSVIAYPNL